MGTRRIIIVLYLVILIGLILTSTKIAAHKKRFGVIFTYDVDYMFYEMAKQIIDEKPSLHNFNDTLEVVYHDKKRLFSKPSHTYHEYFAKIQENAGYLEKLLGKQIFTENFTKRLTKNYRTLQRISTISRITHSILTFRTLGIAKLWTR